jgi:hypothetical protein
MALFGKKKEKPCCGENQPAANNCCGDKPAADGCCCDTGNPVVNNGRCGGDKPVERGCCGGDKPAADGGCCCDTDKPAEGGCCGGDKSAATDCCDGDKPAADGTCACVQVLGSGCRSCHALLEHTNAALRALGAGFRAQYVTDLAAIAASGVMSLPALVVRGRLVASGKVLSAAEAERLLRELGF